MPKQIILGLLGTIGSGKTTASDYLISKGFFRVIMGDLVREKAREEGLELTRENLGKTQEKYRTKYGADYFINETIKRLKESGRESLLIDGIRTPKDAEGAKREGAILILVDAKKNVRFERLKVRAREGEGKKTFKDFERDEFREWEFFKFKETLDYVDYRLDNSGSVEELYKQIDSLLGRIIKNR